MKIVVTGGAGFIGANLTKRLADDDRVTEVHVIDDLSTGAVGNLAAIAPRPRNSTTASTPAAGDSASGTSMPDKVAFTEASILDADALQSVVDGADGIVHLAARPSVPRSIEDPLASHHANATGTLQVLEAARAAGGVHTVLASSSSVYGANPTLPKSEDLRLEPMSPYAVSKQATESYARAYAACYGLPVLAFRFFNVFGPLQPAGHAYAAVVPAFVNAALNGQPLPMYGDGTQTRDFTFVGSVTAVLADAIFRKVADPTPVNLAFGTRHSLKELVDLLAHLLGTDLDVEHLPARTGDVPHSQADNSRLSGLFPDISPVSLQDGLEETIRWFKSSQ